MVLIVFGFLLVSLYASVQLIRGTKNVSFFVVRVKFLFHNSFSAKLPPSASVPDSSSNHNCSKLLPIHVV